MSRTLLVQLSTTASPSLLIHTGEQWGGDCPSSRVASGWALQWFSSQFELIFTVMAAFQPENISMLCLPAVPLLMFYLSVLSVSLSPLSSLECKLHWNKYYIKYVWIHLSDQFSFTRENRQKRVLVPRIGERCWIGVKGLKEGYPETWCQSKGDFKRLALLA